MSFLNAHEEINHVFDAFQNATLNLKPFPHLVVDDLFSPRLMDEIRSNWLEEEAFSPEVKGNHVCLLTGPEVRFTNSRQKAFWQCLTNDIYREVVRISLKIFTPALQIIFGNLIEEPSWGMVPTLMQVDETFESHNPHTHFSNNPNWMLTILHYLEHDSDGLAGTSAYSLDIDVENKSGPDQSRTSSYSNNHLEKRVELAVTPPGDFVVISEEIPYKENRMVCILDGPLSFHGVKKTTRTSKENKNSFDRRILRSHVSVDYNNFSAHFVQPNVQGCDRDKFKRLFRSYGVGLSDGDKCEYNNLINGFFAERIRTYAKACDVLSKNWNERSLINLMLAGGTQIGLPRPINFETPSVQPLLKIDT